MVPVMMAEQQIDIPAVRNKKLPKAADPCSRIKNQYDVIIGFNKNARGIAAILDRILSGSSDRTANTIEGYLHAGNPPPDALLRTSCRELKTA